MLPKFDLISRDPRSIDIPLAQVRAYIIGAHPSEPDSKFEDILLSACEEIERETNGFYVIPQVVAMTHERDEIMLSRWPVQEIQQISVKINGSWKKIFDVNQKLEPEARSKIFITEVQNNSTLLVKLSEWKEKQKVKIVYRTGYKKDETVHAMPYSLRQAILMRCEQIYKMNLCGKEYEQIRKDLVNNLANNFDRRLAMF